MNEPKETEETTTDAELEAEFLKALARLSPDQVNAVGEAMQEMLVEGASG